MLYKLLLLLLCPYAIYCQNIISIPEITNYTKKEYKAGLQNWDIKQDKNGIMYFANNEGLLIFDGYNWQLLPLPNKTNVRSIEIGEDNNIYIGGQDEIGYFSTTTNGTLLYNSIADKIDAKYKIFGDIWNIVSFKNDLYFRTSKYIFKYNGKTVETITANDEWIFLEKHNNILYAQDYKLGLLAYNGTQFVSNIILSSFANTALITSLLYTPNGLSFITTLKNGLYNYNNNTIIPKTTATSEVLKNARVYKGIVLNNNWLALATNNSGVIIIDEDENIIQKLTNIEGLQNNNVLSIFLDKQQNLWLGLDNGIDFVPYNSAIKNIKPQLKDEAGYATIIYDNKLYIGTSSNLYSVGLQPTDDLSYVKGDFSIIEGTKGQNWNLTTINNQLLLGHHEGAMLVTNNVVKRIANENGYWNFLEYSKGVNDKKQIVTGTYKGVQLWNSSNWTIENSIDGFAETSRYVAIDANENIWVSHPYHGVFCLKKNLDGTFTSNLYGAKQGLPFNLDNHVFKIKNEIVVATQNGVLQYNATTNTFEESTYYNSLLGNQSVRYLKEDGQGNIWFVHNKTVGVIDISNTTPYIVYLPELNNKLLSGFEFIYSVNEKNIFVSGEKGLYHVNYEKYKKNIPVPIVQIRSVKISNDKDSILFGGYNTLVNETALKNRESIPTISYKWTTIHFDFACSLYGYQEELEYSILLNGFDKNWSPWTKRTDKEYTNLPEGSYTFQVKVRSNLSNESAITSYSFKVLPPWYKSVLANVVFAILVFVILFFIIKWQQKKFITQQKNHLTEQTKLKYIFDLEKSKNESELVTLRNENLETAINLKNSELASSAMHLVKKGELLTTIKAELTQLMKRLDNENAIYEIKKMIKSLGEDDKMDKDWDVFSKHFDTTQGDFLTKLKEKHATLSNNELKLSAYLRMNLSSKEIAQLLNISVRGVEIGRYRLRKKLELGKETSLFDYLIKL